MNSGHFKTIFSKRLGCLVAVGEHTSNQGKANGAASGQFSGFAGTDWLSTVLQFVGVLTASCALISLAWAGPVATAALPTGGQVAQGAAAISQSGAVMKITQSTPKAVVNWNTFDIGQNAQVNIVQPSANAVMLNRVTSANPSQILGQLNANGQVVLVNPNGVLFGKDGSVNANSFTASTMGISDANFMAGNQQFERNGADASVVNQGSIKTTGGYVALLGASVSNEGKIETQGGTAYLAAAETVKIPVSGSGRIKLELSPSRINAAVSNGKTGTIVTEGGQVYMQAASLSTMVASIIQSGNIDSTGEQGGAVYLLADGGQIKVDGSVTANSTKAATGGDIYIGRDKDTNVLAEVGDVRGAKLESKGGFVETSGQYLATDGVSVKAKDWLLDPYNITITGSASGTTYNDGILGTGGTYSFTPGATSNIKASDIAASLNDGTNVTITTGLTGTSGSDVGNLTVSSAIVKSGNNNASLTLIANNTLTVNARIGKANGDTSSTGKLDVTLRAEGASGAGIAVNNGIDANGGDVDITGFAGASGGHAVLFNNAGISANKYTVTGKTTGGGGVGVMFLNSNTFESSAGDSVMTGTGFANHGVYFNGGETKFTTTGTTATTTVKAGNTGSGIRVNGGSVVNTNGLVTIGSTDNYLFQQATINAQSGTLTLKGKSSSYGIAFQDVSGTRAKVVATGTANIVMDGESTAGDQGVNLAINSGADISTESGSISITGKSATGNGIIVRSDTKITTGTGTGTGGNITLNGITTTGSNGVSGTGILNAKGNIKIEGTGNNGWAVSTNNTVTATGDITITGKSSSKHGINYAGNIESTGGKVTLDADTTLTGGVAGVAGTGGGVAGNNVATIKAKGDISLTGKTNGYWGVYGLSDITSTEGTITLDGTSRDSRAMNIGGPNDPAAAFTPKLSAGKSINVMANGASGVVIWDASTLTAGTFNGGAEGDIKITGTATANGNHGVNFQRYPNAAILKASKDIEITGTANGTSGSGVIMSISGQSGQAPMMDAKGKFTLTGINTNASNTNAAVTAEGGMQVSAGGDIAVKANTKNAAGYALFFNSEASTKLRGNASFKSSNGDVLIQTNQGGINFSNAQATNAVTGTYTSLTEISGKNVTIDNTGGAFDSNGVFGKGTGIASGVGVNLVSAAGMPIKATAGNVNIVGVSTGESGVTLNSSTGPEITAAGDVNMMGISTAAANGKTGIALNGGSSVTGKNVTLTGSSVNGNGIYIAPAVTAKVTANGDATQGHGNIKITGTSSGSPASATALSLHGPMSATNDVVIQGTNSHGSNIAASVYLKSAVTASNGKIAITATTKGTSANALQLDPGVDLKANTSIDLQADTMSIATTVTPAKINAGAGLGTVTIKTDSADANITIGGNNAASATTSARKLGLSQAQLALIAAGNLVIGETDRTGATGHITVDSATTTASTTGNVTLQTRGNITLNAALTVGDTSAPNNLTLNGAGTSTINQSAAIKAAGLELLGANATHTLTSTGNQVATLAANTKAVDYFNSGALKLGSVNTDGVNASGDVSIATGTGDLTIAKNVSTTATSATALKLNAAKSAGVGAAVGSDNSGNIIVSGGSVSVGAGGTAQLMTGSITGNTTAAALANAGNFRYNSDETTTNYSQTLSTNSGGNNGINVIYREKPTVTIQVNNVTKDYDGIAHSGGSFDTRSVAAGLRNGDTDAMVGANALFSGDAQGVKDVLASIGKKISAADNEKNALGYGVSYTDGSLTIRKANLTVAMSNQNKPYDGTTAAVLAAGAITATGVTVDGVAETATVSKASGTYNDKNVAAATTVTASLTAGDFTAGTADLSNYNLPTTVSTAVGGGTISKANLTVAMSNQTKTYDGTTAAALSAGSITATGVTVDGVAETATVSKASGTYNDKNVAAATTVTAILTAGDFAAGTADLSNYNLPTMVAGSGSISKATLTATISDVNTVYGTNASTGAVTFLDKFGTDDVSAGSAGLVGTALSSSGKLKAGTYVQAVGGELTGTDKGNYTFSGTSSANYVVNKLALNTQIAGVTTAYGTVAATGTASLIGVLPGDNVDLGNAKATLVDAAISSSGQLKAGTYKQTVGNTLSGADAANYTATPTTVANYVVTPKAILATVTAADKVYDGNNVATLTANSADILVGDVVNVLGATGTFASKNVARDGSGNAVAQAVTVSGTGVGLGGTDGANYTLTNAASIASTTAKITPKDLTASIADVQTTYGQAAETGKVTLGGVLAGDTVQASAATLSDISLSGSGQLKAGTYTQTVGTSLSGADAANYNTAGTSSQNYVVNKLALATNIAGVTTVYGTAAKTGLTSLQGVLAGDTVALPESTLVDAANSSSGQLKAGTYKQTVGNALSGADAANYTAAPTTVANYVVTPKAILATVTAADKVYDGNNVATLTANSADILSGDVVNVQGATGTFASKNVVRDGSGNAVAQAVTVSGTGMSLGGTDGANYTLTNAASIASTTAKITPKDLSVTGITASDKVYDGSTTAAINTANAVVSGLVAGDSVSVSTQSGVGNLASKDVAFDGAGAGAVASQAVAVSGLSLNGADAVNYNVSDKSGALAKVLQRALNITGSVAQDKTVDGNTNAQVTPGQLGNLVAGETLVVTATGQFADAEIGTNKAVATQYALANGANGIAKNYTLASEVLRAAILVASINPVQPIVNPSRTGGGGRVVVAGSGNSGAAVGVAEGPEEVISREECSVLNPEKCECQESTIAGVEMCFAPTLAANSKN